MSAIAAIQEDPIAAAIKKNLSDKLRGGMAELIPPEVYDRLAAEAVDAFLKGSTTNRMKATTVWMDHNDPRNTTGRTGHIEVMVERTDYNVFEDTATLPGMIMQEIRTLAKESAANVVKTDERFKSVWDVKAQSYMSTALNDIVKDNVDLFVQAMFRQVLFQHVSPMLDQMRRNSF